MFMGGSLIPIIRVRKTYSLSIVKTEKEERKEKKRAKKKKKKTEK